MAEQGWFEVAATVKMRAADGEEAIKRVQKLLEPGVREYGMYLVAEFGARPCENPLPVSGEDR